MGNGMQSRLQQRLVLEKRPPPWSAHVVTVLTSATQEFPTFHTMDGRKLGGPNAAAHAGPPMAAADARIPQAV